MSSVDSSYANHYKMNPMSHKKGTRPVIERWVSRDYPPTSLRKPQQPSVIDSLSSTSSICPITVVHNWLWLLCQPTSAIFALIFQMTNYFGFQFFSKFSIQKQKSISSQASVYVCVCVCDFWHFSNSISSLMTFTNFSKRFILEFFPFFPFTFPTLFR